MNCSRGTSTGRAAPLNWGDCLPDDATLLPGFREELRNLLMRAAEADLSADDLRSWGREHGRVEWIAAADVYAEYEGVMALRSTPVDQGGRYDPATIVARAADALAAWPEGSRAPSWGLVMVDDYQDVTAAGAALLRQMVAHGARLLLVGNADESVQGYRGARPQGLAEAVSQWDATHLELERGLRQHGTLAAVSAAVTARIGVKGVGSARRAARAIVAGRARLDHGGRCRAARRRRRADRAPPLWSIAGYRCPVAPRAARPRWRRRFRGGAWW